MSKAIITDNDLLKEEIKALYNYVNRDEFNLNVVEVMINEIQDIVEGLKPCEESEYSEQIRCPKCHSKRVFPVFREPGHGEAFGSVHYVCKDCYKEFLEEEGERK